MFTCFQHSILHEEISINEKMPLFSKSHKNPAEIVKILRDNLAILEKQDKKTDKVWAETIMLLLKYMNRPKANVKA